MPIAAPAAPPLKVAKATIDDLERVKEKAELIRGRIVYYIATGFLPNIVGGRIFRKLADHIDEQGFGFAFTVMMGFAVPELSSGRESFSPDVSYYSGPEPIQRMKFIRGTPDFAVEVRSEGDYGPAAELAMEDKRADYFEAGTKVVWDVDPEAKLIRSYVAGTAEPIIFGLGEEAHAEPALPGWRMATANLFR